jgi:CRISPR-associated protein Cas2
MILVTYDISNTKTRTKLSKFLERYGRRLQFSVFEISQPDYTIELIKKTINQEFRSKIKRNDSILFVPIFPSLENQIVRIGKTIQAEKGFKIVAS